MHDDESLAASVPRMGDTRRPDPGLPAPSWARGAATPGGVPPMFSARAQVQSPGFRGDELERSPRV